jgi:uncharacterized metal-binding protein YceD (DUF177 family)
MAELTPEFSRPVRLDTLGELPRAIRVEADGTERTALAARFRIVSVERLEADAMLTRIGDAIEASGRIVADVVQACVASGEDVPQAIDEPFTLRFVPEGSIVAGEDEVELDEGELDELTYVGGNIDLGEAVAQTLALALDPYPRAPDAERALKEAGVAKEGEEERGGAFAGLKDLLKR